jgi:hypothetical protein
MPATRPDHPETDNAGDQKIARMATPPKPLVMLRVTDIGGEIVEQALMSMTQREQEMVRLRLGIGASGSPPFTKLPACSA